LTALIGYYNLEAPNFWNYQCFIDNRTQFSFTFETNIRKYNGQKATSCHDDRGNDSDKVYKQIIQKSNKFYLSINK